MRARTRGDSCAACTTSSPRPSCANSSTSRSRRRRRTQRSCGIVEQLSDREILVLRYLPSRLSNPEIARNLYVSVNTLKTHLKHIYRKLGVANRSEAIEMAESLGLL